MWVRELRERLGMSQKDFGLKFHIGVKTVQNWEQGIRQPPDYVVWMINRILELESKT